MLERMGWSGLGLGAKEQGEVEPVGVGDVRVDRADHFRGTLRGPHFVVLWWITVWHYDKLANMK